MLRRLAARRIPITSPSTSLPGFPAGEPGSERTLCRLVLRQLQEADLQMQSCRAYPLIVCTRQMRTANWDALTACI